MIDFVAGLMLAEVDPGTAQGSAANRLNFAMKMQQYTSPVMAKGVEDTAFYRYNRLVCLNEVGSRPDQFGVSVAALHRANVQRAAHWPAALLATSTHDTKRGEDARARLAALSEVPDVWEQQLRICSRLVRARLGDVESIAAPSANDEYLLLQNLLASWPVELRGPQSSLDQELLTAFGKRIEAAMVKSVREAKQYSSWTRPDEAYETALGAYIAACMDVSRPNGFLEAFLPFQQRIARAGRVNSLGQLVLKLTVPGVPDIYQGAERWDLNLVDPDNRRPVDYDLRRAALQSWREDPRSFVARSLDDGRGDDLKLALTAALLALRCEQAGLFARGDYEAVEVQGERAEHVIAFRRSHGDSGLLVLICRLPQRLEDAGGWGDTRVPLLAEPGWTDMLGGHRIEDGESRVAAVLGDLPVAVLLRQAP